MSELKCIDTAPKDGTKIIVYDGSDFFSAWFTESDIHDEDNDSGWESNWEWNIKGITHWMPMPLPPPPKKKHYCENKGLYRCYTAFPEYDQLYFESDGDPPNYFVAVEFCPLCGEKA